jgi:hypothetical protein
MTYDGFKDKVLSTLTLFSSFSTLLCCALPAFFVALGAGGVMAGLVSAVPQLVIVSHHKPAVFTFAGVMLSLSAFMQWRNRTAACSIDPIKAQACKRLRKISLVVFIVSLAAYATGFFFTFIAPYLLSNFR